MRLFKLNRKLMTISLCILIFFVFTLSIGYAALSVTLNITGNSQVNASNWNIYLTNPIVKEGSVTDAKPAITSNVTANFSVNLTTPGDFYEFTIDIKNDGDINALIEGINKTPELTETQLKYLNYVITYDDDSSVEVDQILNVGETKKLKIRVEYRIDLVASDLPSSSEMLQLSFVVDYVQNDESDSSSSGGGIAVAKAIVGDGTNVGDEIAIGNEEFYVISNDGTNLAMLAKYNLRVGMDSYYEDMTDAHGLQDSSSKGFLYYGFEPYNSIVPFSEQTSWDYYWYPDDDSMRSEPVYVYSDQTDISIYVNNYKTYLEGMGINVTEARLINYNEITSLGCTFSDDRYDAAPQSCVNAPEWVYATTYWTGIYIISSTGESNRIVTVNSKPDDFWYSFIEYIDGYAGVRPVIIIPSSSVVVEQNTDVVRVAYGDGTNYGDLIEIGDEYFYVMENDGTNIKLLARYNLQVGRNYDNSYTNITNPSGIQDENSRGWLKAGGPNNSVVPFSSSAYWSSSTSTYPAYVYNDRSSIKSYVDTYKTYLENKGVTITEARLISYEELQKLTCSLSSNNICVKQARFVYNTSYWTGSAPNGSNMYAYDNNPSLMSIGYTYSEDFGVRPVIVIPATSI